MKRGHVTGTKREGKGAGDWYKQIEAEHIRKIEAAWGAKQASSEEYYPESDGDPESSSGQALVPWDRAA